MKPAGWFMRGLRSFSLQFLIICLFLYGGLLYHFSHRHRIDVPQRTPVQFTDVHHHPSPDLLNETTYSAPDVYRWADTLRRPPYPIVEEPRSDRVLWVWIVHYSGDESRASALRETWLRHFDHTVGIVAFGRPPLHLLPLHTVVVETHGGAFYKTQQAFQGALQMFPSATFYSKFDDDTYVYTKNLHKRLFASQGQPIPYGGYPLKNEGVVFASGGAGYTLDHASASRLSQCPQHLSTYEDLGVRKCLDIDPVDLVGLHPHHPWQMLRWDKDGHSSDHVRVEPLEGYLTPLSYHYMTPEEMRRMHDDTYSVGGPSQRTRGIPKVLHQFWVGNRRPPAFAIESCCDLHEQWTHTLWDNQLILERFPQSQLVNQAHYNKPVELNLLSDIVRYEFLLLWGGVYVDADTHCLLPFDHLWRDLFLNPQTNPNDGFCVYESEQYTSNIEGHQLVATGVLALVPFSPTAMVLIHELHHTDWTLPAWMSAGPLFATKLFKRLQLPMTYLPSQTFYPYHHRDTRPASADEMYRYLRDKESLTDQLWSTTHATYPTDQAMPTPAELLASHPSSFVYEGVFGQLLQRYTETHLRGLSPISRKRPRWIVVPTEPAAGMCNRIMNLLSALILAIATDRILLFDWDHVEPRVWYDSQTEKIGHSGYHETFGNAPIAFSYQNALRYIGWTDAKAHDGSVTVDWRHPDFLSRIHTNLIDSEYPQSVLFVGRFDWWGPLVLRNPFYHHLFGGIESSEAFSQGFRYLFPPPATIKESPPCDWFVQTRRNWERKTAPLSAFVECAEKHGYAKTKGQSYLLSDTSESPADSGLVPVDSHYCRDGSSGCDRQSVETMYHLSHCRSAVLTHTSTFGACIAGLGQLKDVYRVTAEGRCERQPTVDPPLDIGILPGQVPDVLNAMSAVQKPYSAAFVYLMMESSRKSIAEFRRSLGQLHEHFNRHHHYPIVVFVESKKRWRWLQYETSVRVHLVEINPQDWAVPQTATDYPEVFRLRSSPDHQGFPVAYRQMSRYAAGYLLSHPALAPFTYVLKIDADTLATGPWSKDPFEEMHRKQAKFAYWVAYSDTPDVTDHLWSTFNAYLSDHHLELTQPDLVLQGGEYRRSTFYGCFLAMETAFFRRPEYRDLFQYLDATHGWFKYRWDEQKVYAFYVALYLRKNEIEFMDYVSVEHQVWATKPMDQLGLSTS